MIPVTAVLLDESERDLVRRVTPLVPMAYPLSSDPVHLRPVGPVVDENDRRVRVLDRLAGQRGLLVTFDMAQLAVEVLDRLHDVVAAQTEPQWWREASSDRGIGSSWEGAEAMIEVMVAERSGQLPGVVKALVLMQRVLMRMTERDDPTAWLAREDGPEVGRVAPVGSPVSPVSAG